MSTDNIKVKLEEVKKAPNKFKEDADQDRHRRQKEEMEETVILAKRNPAGWWEKVTKKNKSSYDGQCTADDIIDYLGSFAETQFPVDEDTFLDAVNRIEFYFTKGNGRRQSLG